MKLLMEQTSNETVCNETVANNYTLDFGLPSQRIMVQRMSPVTLSWSFDDLKKREASELQDGGPGSAVLTRLPSDVPSSSKTFPENHNSKRKRNQDSADHERLEDIKRMEDTIAVITSSKWEAKTQLENLLSKYPNDDEVLNFMYIMRDIYRYDNMYENSSRGEYGEHVSTFNEQGDTSNQAIVLSQNRDDSLSQIWFTPHASPDM